MKLSGNKDNSFYHILEKARKYCAYQERSHLETRKKLITLGLPLNEVGKALAQLITENFLNEERFARTFARGHFKIKKWGKKKIIFELKKRKINDYCIKKALEEIDSKEYILTLEQIISKKQKEIKNTEDFSYKAKIASYCITRGYEYHEVWDSLQNI